MSKHKLDLHDIFYKGDQIDPALREAMDLCIDRRIDMLGIIPGLTCASTTQADICFGER